MSEDIDKHVLRKYEIVSKLGKGKPLSPKACVALGVPDTGRAALRRVRYCVEGNRQENQRGRRSFSHLLALSTNSRALCCCSAPQ
eukprot:2466393-Rhodomonas_salina.3